MDRVRRDFLPEDDIVKYLDTVPTMSRSRVINEAIRKYHRDEQNLKHSEEVIEMIKSLDNKLNRILKLIQG